MGSHIPPAKKEALADINAIHKFLKLGFVPFGVTPKRGGLSALGMAAKERGVPSQTLANRIARNGPYGRTYGLKVDWSLWKPKEIQEVSESESRASLEPILHRRLTDRAIAADRRAAEAERRAIAAEGLREAVFKLAEEPLKPPSWNPQPLVGKEKHPEAIVLFLSDLHIGNYHLDVVYP